MPTASGTWTERSPSSRRITTWSASAPAQDEWRVGIEELKAQLERDFSQAEALSVDYEPVVVSEAGAVAWVAGRARVQARVDGQDLTLAGRFTAVLEHRNDRWLLVQTHFSLPAAEQAEGRSF
jgi:ketosteroid isomerase-like protein